jgi:hypothetical protein
VLPCILQPEIFLFVHPFNFYPSTYQLYIKAEILEKLLRIVTCMTELSNGHKCAGLSCSFSLSTQSLPSKHAAKNGSS